MCVAAPWLGWLGAGWLGFGRGVVGKTETLVSIITSSLPFPSRFSHSLSLLSVSVLSPRDSLLMARSLPTRVVSGLASQQEPSRAWRQGGSC